MPSGRNDPFMGYNFAVDIAGIGTLEFAEVAGLGFEITPVEYRSGGDLAVRKLAGLRKFPNILLKRGYTPDRKLWDWAKQALDGTVARAAIAITLLDDKRQPLMRWKVREAWPCKYEGPVFNAAGSAVAIEIVEICHEGIELDPA